MAAEDFCPLHLGSEFFRNTCVGKEIWRLTKENIRRDIFHGFQPPVNLMKWLQLLCIQVITIAPRVSFFRYIETLYHFMSLVLDVLSVYKLQNRYLKNFFFQFWESENTGLFSSVTAPILNKTYFSLNLRKDWPLIKSYLLHRSSQARETLFLRIFGNLLGAIFNQPKEHVLIIDQISTCKFLL